MGAETKKRGDPILECPKCKSISGDSWGQCGGKCPVLFSPHYDYKTRKKYGPLIVKEST